MATRDDGKPNGLWRRANSGAGRRCERLEPSPPQCKKAAHHKRGGGK